MHNNGTNRLTFPDGRPLIADDARVLSTVPQAPRQGFQLEVRPNALICHITDGDTKLDLTLDPRTATQLGVNLISAATISGSGLLPVPLPEPEKAPEAPAEKPPEPEPESEANDTIVLTD